MTPASPATRRISIAAVLLTLAFVPVIAQNPPGPGGRGGQFGPPPGGRGPMGDGSLALERLGRELGFTDAQKAAIDALLTEQRTALKSSIDSVRQSRQALDAAVLTVPTDEGLLQAQVSQLSSLEAQISLARAHTEAKIFQLLNADQQQTARQLIADMQQPGPHRGGRPGRQG